MDKAELLLLYEKFGSIGKVAAHLCKPYAIVRHWYRRYGIKVQENHVHIFHEIRKTPMSDQQKSVILGSLLGHGDIRLAPHSKNAILRVGHYEKQLKYLMWKNAILKPFSRNIEPVHFDKVKLSDNNDNMGLKFYRFSTIAHPDITYFYKKYIVDNKKSINSDIINEMNLISMSIWFADVGSIYYNKKNGGLICSIATNDFSYKEQLILVEFLRKFFKGTIKILKKTDSAKDDFYISMFRTKYIIEFLENIKSILPACIHYRLDPQRLGVRLPIRDEGIVRTT